MNNFSISVVEQLSIRPCRKIRTFAGGNKKMPPLVKDNPAAKMHAVVIIRDGTPDGENHDGEGYDNAQ